MKTKLNLIVATAIMLMFGTACTKKNDNGNNPGMPGPVTGVVLTSNAKFGNIITDNNGNSLYFFSVDNAATSNCTGDCLTFWRPFYKENPSIGTGLTASDFGVINRTDGNKQTTYKGWPLYYYIDDKAVGDTKGDGSFNAWFIAKADYSVMIAMGQLVGLDGANYKEDSKFGTGSTTYITDAGGHTGYMFTHDTANTNTFDNGVEAHDALWPVLSVDAVGSVPSILNKADFSIITVFGKKQLVYKGHPLYNFGQDAGVRGSTKGISFPTPNSAIWKVTNNNTPAL